MTTDTPLTVKWVDASLHCFSYIVELLDDKTNLRFEYSNFKSKFIVLPNKSSGVNDFQKQKNQKKHYKRIQQYIPCKCGSEMMAPESAESNEKNKNNSDENLEIYIIQINLVKCLFYCLKVYIKCFNEFAKP